MEYIDMFFKSRKNILKKTIVVFCLGLLFSSCEKDPDIGLYIIESDGTMSKPTFDVIVDAVTDYDGNAYAAVKIGEQVWMKENLRTTHYADGTSIPKGNSISTTEAFWYYPNNSSANKTIYGLLYNWKAVMGDASSSSANPSGVQGICPSGWHVPSDEEWMQLEMTLGMSQSDANGTGYRGDIAAKLSGNTEWTSSSAANAAGNLSAYGRNSSGFSALPAGNFNGSFNGVGDYAYFWDSSQRSGTLAWGRNLNYGSAGVYRGNDLMSNGYSVRCLRDESGSATSQLPTVITTSVSNVSVTSATSGGNVTSSGSSSVTARGVCWSNYHNPTVSDNHTTNGSGTGSFTGTLTGLNPYTTYYVRAYATNSSGTAYGNEVSFTTSSSSSFSCGTSTVSDYDGNTYNTVLIGTQCWMKTNLRTTHYANGTAIAAGSTTSTTVAYRYRPDNNANYVTTYGYLYNWKAVMHTSSSSSSNPSWVQGICPTGWHVPSDAEWLQLINYVSSRSQYRCSNNSENIAKALAGTTGWNSSTNTCAVGNTPSQNNATGFSALPAGGYYGSYVSPGSNAYFWSATESGSSSSMAYIYNLNTNSAYVDRDDNSKMGAYSVRCVKD